MCNTDDCWHWASELLIIRYECHCCWDAFTRKSSDFDLCQQFSLGPMFSTTVFQTRFCKCSIPTVNLSRLKWTSTSNEMCGPLCQIYVATCAPARDPSAGYIAWGHSTLVGPVCPSSSLFLHKFMTEINMKKQAKQLDKNPVFQSFKPLFAVHYWWSSRQPTPQHALN